MEQHQPRSAGDEAQTAVIGTASSVPTRVCHKCSVQSQAAGEFCPHCGTPFMRRGRRFGKKSLAAVVAVLVICAAATGIVLTVRHNHAAHAKAVAAAAAQRKAIAAQQAAAAAAAAKEAADKQERQRRAGLVASLESSITKDMRKRVRDYPDLYDGPILSTSCTPLGGGSTDDLTALTGDFECVAINKKNNDGTESGYRFSGTINYNDESWTWHLGS